jgi:hypothetical protein
LVNENISYGMSLHTDGKQKLSLAEHYKNALQGRNSTNINVNSRMPG